VSVLTLQELLAGLTFILTLANIWNSVNAARSAKARQLMDDPKIVKIHTDVEYIRLAMDRQENMIEKRTGRVDGEIKELLERVIRLEAKNDIGG